MSKAVSAYSINDWKEDPMEGNLVMPGKKVSKVSCWFGFQDELEGKGFVDYTMFYTMDDPQNPHLSTASYVGMVKFEGKVHGKEGSFLMEDRGGFGDGVAKSVLKILQNSGTGELEGIEGDAHYKADVSGHVFTLTYKLPTPPTLSRKDRAVKYLQLTAKGQAEEAFSELVKEDEFIHHNMHFAPDVTLYKQAVIENGQKFPNKILEVKKIYEDGDCVIVFSHCRMSPEDMLGLVLVHTFRFRDDDNRIVELWDVGTPIPENSPNTNGVF